MAPRKKAASPKKPKASPKKRAPSAASSARAEKRERVYIVKVGNWYQAETGRTKRQSEAKRFRTARGAAQWAKSRGGRVLALLLKPKRKRGRGPISVRPTAREPEPKRVSGKKRRRGDAPEGTRRLTRAERLEKFAHSTIERGAKSVVPEDRKRAVAQTEVLLDLAKHADKQARTEAKNRAKALNAWSTGVKKGTKEGKPSRAFTDLFRQLGHWHRNADGTYTGEIRLMVPHAFQCDWDMFRYWLGDWEIEHDWLRDEPLWYSVGLQISGVERDKRNRYDRIHGRVGITSYWARDIGEEKDIGGKRIRRGVGLGVLMTNMREAVAENVINAGRCIYAVIIFAHWGPYAPVFG